MSRECFPVQTLSFSLNVLICSINSENKVKIINNNKM